jgi:hypothetical protein
MCTAAILPHRQVSEPPSLSRTREGVALAFSSRRHRHVERHEVPRDRFPRLGAARAAVQRVQGEVARVRGVVTECGSEQIRKGRRCLQGEDFVSGQILALFKRDRPAQKFRRALT